VESVIEKGKLIENETNRLEMEILQTVNEKIGV
jgi:hypothetical protein